MSLGTINASHNTNKATASPNIDTNHNNNIGIMTTVTHNADHNAVNSTTSNSNSTHHSAPSDIPYHALTSKGIPCSSEIHCSYCRL